MNELSKTEEQLMEIIWQLQPVFMKDILDAIPEPKAAPSTIATLLKRMQEKGFVGYELFGNSRQYKALIEKEVYFSSRVKNMIKTFFNDSAAQFASFFTEKIHLTEKELQELKGIIDQQIKNQRNE